MRCESCIFQLIIEKRLSQFQIHNEIIIQCQIVFHRIDIKRDISTQYGAEHRGEENFDGISGNSNFERTIFFISILNSNLYIPIAD
jgi:hypothetical protein